MRQDAPQGRSERTVSTCLLGVRRRNRVARQGRRFDPPRWKRWRRCFLNWRFWACSEPEEWVPCIRRQPALDRWVALKVLPAGGGGGPAFEERERFNREARALARLNHPISSPSHEFRVRGHLHYFIMGMSVAPTSASWSAPAGSRRAGPPANHPADL